MKFILFSVLTLAMNASAFAGTGDTGSALANVNEQLTYISAKPTSKRPIWIKQSFACESYGGTGSALLQITSNNLVLFNGGIIPRGRYGLVYNGYLTAIFGWLGGAPGSIQINLPNVNGSPNLHICTPL